MARPLGEWLRQRREELGISLEQAEVETRIRRRYLEALETEDLNSLPDPFVGRGFLRNYAAYLGLDAAQAAGRYTEIGAPPPPPLPPVDDSAFRAEPFRPVPLHHMPGFRVRRGWLLGLVAVAAVAVGLLAWQGAPYIYRWFYAGRAARPTATHAAVPATEQVATAPTLELATAAPTRTRPAATDTATPRPQATLTLTWTPSPSPSASPPVYTGIFMELVFTGTSWIQVTVDGVREFQGELTAETYRSWYGEERIELRIGNAGVVKVTLNGQSLGTLGAFGEVVDRVFERAGGGWAEVTATITPTLEFTPEASPLPTSRPRRTPTSAPISPTLPISPTTSP